jgi:hypothetical protein
LDESLVLSPHAVTRGAGSLETARPADLTTERWRRECNDNAVDKIDGADFVRRVRAMGIEQVLTAPRSPW